jgi:hypothetical protein
MILEIFYAKNMQRARLNIFYGYVRSKYSLLVKYLFMLGSLNVAFLAVWAEITN